VGKVSDVVFEILLHGKVKRFHALNMKHAPDSLTKGTVRSEKKRTPTFYSTTELWENLESMAQRLRRKIDREQRKKKGQPDYPEDEEGWTALALARKLRGAQEKTTIFPEAEEVLVEDSEDSEPEEVAPEGTEYREEEQGQLALTLPGYDGDASEQVGDEGAEVDTMEVLQQSGGDTKAGSRHRVSSDQRHRPQGSVILEDVEEDEESEESEDEVDEEEWLPQRGRASEHAAEQSTGGQRRGQRKKTLSWKLQDHTPQKKEVVRSKRPP
jgi:hypothetical protein